MVDITRLVKAPKNKNELGFLRRKYYNGIIRLASYYNAAIFSFEKKNDTSSCYELNEIRQRSRIPSDISDHLETLFTETLQVQPKLIVELGVGPGQSTYVFERVAKLSGACFISVDIRPEMKKASDWSKWIFVPEDDIKFAGRFVTWAKEHNIEPKIDILFIDTSHKYDHTVQEIKNWFPFLSERAKVFFHDTNTGAVYWHHNGAIGFSYDIQRGVIRAVEEYFNTKFNEKRNFVDLRDGWLIKHHAFCNGLTMLQRI